MVVINPREEFLAATSEADPTKLIQFAEKHVSKKDEFNLGEIFQSLSNKQQRQLWSGLFSMCGKALERLRDNEVNEDDQEKTNIQDTLVCIEAISDVLLASIEQETQVVPNKMTATATILHGVMLDLPDDAEKLRQKITTVCQTWWVKELPGYEGLAPNMILCVLTRCSQPQVIRETVKSANTIRKALSLIQWGDPTSADLELLLEQCIINPLVLKVNEGRTFLSYLFGLNVDLIEKLHSAIKSQLPSCSKTMVQYYGDVYFKAWKQATGEILMKIEEHCIQDLMYLAAHAPRGGAKSLSSILRQLLCHFAQQKRQQCVDKMLLRLYNPILWRALSAANAGVRANAASLLVDAFPLQDPESNKEEMDAILQKQIDALENLLDDPCPLVRVVGIQGVCRICGTFWELIPAHTLAAFLTKLIQQLVYDSASTDVRVNIFKGLSFVLDNPMSHPLLKHLLPTLKDFIHDTSEKVILTFLDLLIKIKGLKTIKVFGIVPIEDLLARLEMDSPPVARRIVKLLFNSFHPMDSDPSVLIDRLIMLIRANSAASRVFYCYAIQHMPVAYSVDFLLLLCRCIRGCIRDARETQPPKDGGGDTLVGSDTSNLSNESNADEEEKENENEDGLSLKDTDVMEGMLEVVAILWSGITSELAKPVNETLKQKLVSKYGKALPDFLATFQEGRSVQAILVLATYLPASSIPSFSNGCLSTLKSLPSNATSDTYRPLLTCLVSWGRGSDVLDMIINWFIPALQKSSDPESGIDKKKNAPASKNSKKNKRVAFIEPVLPRPDLGLKYLDALLQHYPSCTRLLQSSTHKVVELVDTLACAMGRIEKRFLGTTGTISDDILVESISAYIRLLVHLQAKFNSDEGDASASSSMSLNDFSPQFVKLMLWAELELLPVLKTPVEAESAEANKALVSFAKDVVKNLLIFLGDAVLLSVGDSDFKEEVMKFSQCALQTDHSLDFMVPAAKLVYHLSNQTLQSYLQLPNNDIKVKDHISPALSVLVKALSREFKARENPKEDHYVQETLAEVKPLLTECLKACHGHQSILPALDQEIMASVMASILAEVADEVRKMGHVPVDSADTYEDLPPLSAFLLGILSSSQPLLNAFVLELQRCLSVGALEKPSDMCAALNILCVLKQGGKRISNLEECLMAAEKQLDLLAPDGETQGEDAAEELERFWFSEAKKLHGIATGAIQPLPLITDQSPSKKKSTKRQCVTDPPILSGSSENTTTSEGSESVPTLGSIIGSLSSSSQNSSGTKMKRKLYDGSSSLLL